MKYITVFLLVIVSNYVFAQTDESQKFYTSTELNISAGHFQVYQLSNWEVGSSTCWEFTINKAYNSTQWLASSMLIVKGNKESKFARISTYNTKNSDEVRASYVDLSKKKPKIEEIIFAEGLKIGEPFRFSFVVTKKNVVAVKYNKQIFSFPLGFSPKNIQVGASSSNTTVKELSNSECEN